MNVTTESVALYGAVVATISILIALFSLALQAVTVVRDKKKVLVKLSYNNRIFGEDSPYKEGEDYISMDIINSGRRPVTITSIGLMLYTARKYLPVDAVRKGRFTLQEGEKETFVMEQKLVKQSTVRYVYAIDSTGIAYKKNMDSFLVRFIKLPLFKFKIFK